MIHKISNGEIIIKRILAILAVLAVFLFVLGLYKISRSDHIIPNAELERVIIEQIGFSGDKLKPEDCLGITELDLSATNLITDLEGLQYFKDLEVLYCCASYINDISELSELKNLKELDLSLNRISDLSPLSDLKRLKKLNLYNNRVKDLSPLSNLISLKHLEIGKNVWITDASLEPLYKLHGLKVTFLLDHTVEIP